MASPTQHAAADDLVERMGLLWEEEGLPRIAGRMIGFLLLQPDACSLDEMAESLGVSKASVSVDARRLERIGFVERVGRPGDRRDYYAIGADMLARVLTHKLEGVRRLQDAIASARRLPGNAPAVRQRLTEFERHHGRVLSALEGLLADLRVAPTHDSAPSD
jgi:DNA-binding transcriptional regulator GbsR (MarR family)